MSEDLFQRGAHAGQFGFVGGREFAEQPVAFSQEALANRKIAAEEARVAMLTLADLPADSPAPQS